MQIETRLSEQIAQYLDLATSEAKLTAANMANIDTPGYQALGMNFEAEMREALGDVDGGRRNALRARKGSRWAGCAARWKRCLHGP